MNQEHYDILMKGVDVWNKWRKENPDIRPDLKRANLKRANLKRVNLSRANLKRAKLNRADLKGANLRKANLKGANLFEANLSRVDLSRANLFEANLFLADLFEANLQKTDFMIANLYEANLTGANLKEADLSGANLCKANLKGANLKKTKLSSTNLSSANLDDVDFKKSNLGSTNLDKLDLTNCRNLLLINHQGPSFVDSHTLTRSRGRIPDQFLQGIGMKNWEIQAAKLHDPSLSIDEVVNLVYKIENLRNGSPLQIHNLFISYSRTDGAFVDILEPLLRSRDISFWRDIHHAMAGPLEKVVDRAMHQKGVVLLILSEDSVVSDWVEYEVEEARQMERKGVREHVLCPIALDDAWQHCKWPKRIRNQVEKYNILDFSNWQDEDFLGQQFGKLVNGLDLFYKE